MSISHKSSSASSKRFPIYTWLGASILIISELLLLQNQRTVITWFTPIMWTGYILAMDGWLSKRTGFSWLTTQLREFLFLILASVGIWVLFEAYNFYLQNWLYQSVPPSPGLRLLAYFWSFATIIPGVFLTAQIIESFLPIGKARATRLPELGPRSLWFAVGLAMVVLPITVPMSIARYLFATVWIGFTLLIDPINERIGAPSMRKMLEQGSHSRIIALLVGGFLCGLLWEAWNFQAFLKDGGHWIYTVPEGLHVLGLHYGQMPLLGMLGFPPFALELYALYHFFRKVLEGSRLIGPYYW